MSTPYTQEIQQEVVTRAFPRGDDKAYVEEFAFCMDAKWNEDDNTFTFTKQQLLFFAACYSLGDIATTIVHGDPAPVYPDYVDTEKPLTP